jgi:hypothetical protein
MPFLATDISIAEQNLIRWFDEVKNPQLLIHAHNIN